MIKRIVVAGCRDYENYAQAKTFIDLCICNIREKYTLIFVSGGCRGADEIGERYAYENGYEIERYPAERETYGKSAGPRRNRKMAEIADYVICFWNGKSRGTKNMIDCALELHKPVRVKRI